MKRYGIMTALLLLLVVNGIVLGGVYYNRSGVPEATLTMTERELPLAYNYRHKENSGVTLRLNWHRQGWKWEWFDEAKVLELGFDRQSVFSDEKPYRYYDILPIKAFIVLEYDGDAWNEYQKQQQKEIDKLPAQVAAGTMEQDAADRRKKELLKALELAPRLFAIDVGMAPQRLRNHYPDRQKYLILPAKVRASVHWEAKDGSKERVRVLQGHIDQVLTENIYVPREYHAILGALPNEERLHARNHYYSADSKQRAHYRVQLNVGQRYEPWIYRLEELGD